MKYMYYIWNIVNKIFIFIFIEVALLWSRILSTNVSRSHRGRYVVNCGSGYSAFWKWTCRFSTGAVAVQEERNWTENWVICKQGVGGERELFFYSKCLRTNVGHIPTSISKQPAMILTDSSIIMVIEVFFYFEITNANILQMSSIQL